MPNWFPGAGLAWRRPRWVRTCAGWSCAGIVLVLVILMAIPAMLSLFGYRSYVIYGGSMGSSLPAGSVGLTRTVDSSSLKVGDVIAIRRTGGAVPVLHRIVRVEADGSATVYTTQGDRNASPDPEPVTLQGTGDRVAFAIPYLGYLVHFARGVLGRVLLLFLPSFLLIAPALWQRWRPRPQPVYAARGEPEC